jgi:hypothetical protein
VRWPPIAAAASSAFQIDRDGLHRLLFAQLPASYPISAVASELFAFSSVIRALPTGDSKVVVVADCQAVIQAFLKPDQHANYRSRFGGMWREKGLDREFEVLKVKAHLTQEEAMPSGTEHHWFGND